MSMIATPKELLWADSLSYLYIVMMSVICFKSLQPRYGCMCVCVHAHVHVCVSELLSEGHQLP